MTQVNKFVYYNQVLDYFRYMSEKKKGTPKSLNEAIQNGLDSMGIEPPQVIISSTRESINTCRVEIIKQHMRDFIAQQFQVAIFNSEKPCESLKLEELFNDIFGRENE